MAEAVRDRWSNKATFIFAAIGSAIGLGNVWRFPYLVQEYGGGAFLIPYLVCVVLFGIPWLMMEFGMGRYFQKGAPGVFEGIGKKWEWLGWWPATVAFLIVGYYAVILAWSLRFVISSVTMEWGTGRAGAEAANGFFYDTILQLSSGLGDFGSIMWLTVVCLLLVWAVMFFSIYRGAEASGKWHILFVILPWILLVAVTVRGMTLPGAMEGLNSYLSPDFSQLTNPDVWFGAASQVAFSLSVGMAGMFAYGSWVAKKADITNSTVIASFGDLGTAFLSGFAVFSVVGFLVQGLNIPMSDVSTNSLGLAFVTYPAAVSMMPGGNAIVGILFFLSLFTIGVDSAFFLAHGGVIAPLTDKFGWSVKKTTFWVCVVGFLTSLLYCTQAGLYWLDIVDRSVSFYGLIITGLLATLVIGWKFGADKLRLHLNSTSDIKVGPWWNWLLKLVVPLGLLFCVIYGGFVQDLAYLWDSSKTEYGGYGLGSLWIWGILLITLLISIGLSLLKSRKKGDK
ncbi:MAG: sodium-dependent transporter [Dehalococcoidales bacterium]|nr:sodium-dependent transporter [Dehalococcoidales bacterium]MDX9986679.1 sodium-dependent transporter [Dehalococcoidales bacterium]NLE90278.1 sodium-dependent transporter [Dehalococcoidales bacterium]